MFVPRCRGRSDPRKAYWKAPCEPILHVSVAINLPRPLIRQVIFARHKFYLYGDNDRARAAARDQFRAKIDRRRRWHLRNDDEDETLDELHRRLDARRRCDPTHHVLSISTAGDATRRDAGGPARSGVVPCKP